MKQFVLQCIIPLLTVLFLASCSPRGTSDNPGPNVLVVLVDDLRWDEFGLAGHNYIQTPNIDRVAQEGAYFQNAFTTTPLCSPSRASFLTGLYAHSNGITDNTARNVQSHKLETFPKVLNAQGYETAFIGKWHMGNDDTPRPGFDYWVALKGQGEAIDPGLNINGERQVVKGYVTDIFTDYSLQFIRKQRNKPFLLYLSHKALHPNHLQRDDGSSMSIGEGGFIPADRHKGMYDTAVFSRRPNNGIPPVDKPALMRQINDLPSLGEQTATPEKAIRERAEMLMAVDEGLGTLMDELEKMNQLDNTIIVFTSDHGYWYGEHGLNEERRLAYEEAIRIPLLIRYPPLVEAGSKPKEMVLSIDLAPTVIELAGVEPDAHLQGRSLVPIFNHTVKDWRTSLLVEYYSDTVFPRIVNMGYKAVRNERYKYIHYVDLEGMDELYDLQNDPYELKNIINDSAAAQILEEMKSELKTQLESTSSILE